jgi:hypothetical protein
MAQYHRTVDKIAGHYRGLTLNHIDGRKKEASEALSRVGSSRSAVPPGMFLEYRHQPSIKMKTKFELTNPTSNELASVAVYAIIPD